LTILTTLDNLHWSGFVLWRHSHPDLVWNTQMIMKLLGKSTGLFVNWQQSWV
jgi:hypothetical protein